MKKLSNENMKRIMGGAEDTTFCSNGGSCSYYEAHTGTVDGTCEENSNGRCVCKGPNSSIVTSDCAAT